MRYLNGNEFARFSSSSACFPCALKSPWIFHRSPWIFLKAPGIKITFVKKSVLCKGKIESTTICTFSWWSWKCVFLQFHCPWHSSFSFFWNTLGTVPSWWKVLQKGNPPPLTNLKDLYFMSFNVKLQGKEVLGRIILVLEKSLIFPQKFHMNHVLWSSVNKVTDML